jgi:hypothetical protein
MIESFYYSFYMFLLLLFWNNLLFLRLYVFVYNTMAFLLYSVYPLSFCDKKGEYFLFWTGNVFSNQSSVFCRKMAKGEFVFMLAIFWMTKTLYVMVAI